MTETPKLRVVLADDHLLVLEGLVALIENTPDMDIVGQATTGAQAYGLIRDLKPDVAVLDVCMPDMSSFAVAKGPAEEGSTAQLVALSFHEDRTCFKHAMEIGFRGYVCKRSASETLLFAIRSVAKGGFHIDPILAGQIVGLDSSGFGRSDDGDSTLTTREEEVLKQIALGLTLKEIATQLGVTEKSIETYKARASEMSAAVKTRVFLARAA